MTALQKTDEAAALMEKVLISGDLKSLTPAERMNYYSRVCESVGLNPFTRPFDYIQLNGKLTLYAKRDATDQLRDLHGVSITDLIETERDGVFIVTAKAVNAKGRTDVAKGAVNISGLKGDNLANALMKAETKAKRRVTLSLCGLGWLDETEIETISDARPVTVTDQCEVIQSSNLRAIPSGKAETGPQQAVAVADADLCKQTAKEPTEPISATWIRELYRTKGIDIDAKLKKQGKPPLEDLSQSDIQVIVEWVKSLPSAEQTASAKQVEYFFSELVKLGNTKLSSRIGQLEDINNFLFINDIEINHDVYTVDDLPEPIAKRYARYLADQVAAKQTKVSDALAAKQSQDDKVF